MIDRIAHIYFTHTDDRGGEIPVAASPRRPVTMAAGSLSRLADASPDDSTSAGEAHGAGHRDAIAAAIEAGSPESIAAVVEAAAQRRRADLGLPFRTVHESVARRLEQEADTGEPTRGRWPPPSGT